MHDFLRAAVSASLVLAFFSSPDPAVAQGPERLQVHGFITQGLGRSNDLGVAGIEDHATWDYRTAALQFGYQINDTERFVFQMGHRRLAHSPLSETVGDVFVDWGFIQKSFGTVAVRAGKIPMPRGIYNETRDIGILLPFYRAPLSFYTEGIETIDGVTALRTTSLGGDWELETSAYVGSWIFVQVQASESDHAAHEAAASTLVTNTRAQGAMGGQVWLNTPIVGLRLGFGAQRFDMENDGLQGFFGAVHAHGDEEAEEVDGHEEEGEEEGGHGEEEAMGDRLAGSLWQVALDGSFDRLTLRGEYQIFALDAMTYYAGYGQVGVRMTERVSAHVQGELSRVRHVDGQGTLEFRHTRDFAAALNLRLTPTLLLKAEGHAQSGHAFDTFVDLAGPGATTKYFIFSVSAAF